MPHTGQHTGPLTHLSEHGDVEDQHESGDSIAKGGDPHADALLRIARKHDKSAFQEVFTYFGPRLKGYLMKLGCGAGQAEELVQETMLSVWRKAGQFDPDRAGASTWIFSIARNRRIDVLRRETFPEIDPSDPAFVPDDPEMPEEALINLYRSEAVRHVLADLPSEQRELIQLAFYHGWSHREIAAQTDLPLGTVKSRLRLAFARLRKELEARV